MSKSSKLIVKALIGAAAIIGAALIMAYLSKNGIIEKDSATRWTQFVIGLMLIATGNLIPKTLEPLTRSCSNPAREQSLKRFTGWAFVLSGILYSVIWLAAPLEYASGLSMVVVILAIVSVVVPIIWIKLKRKRALPPV